jgi:hypothetical protein
MVAIENETGGKESSRNSNWNFKHRVLVTCQYCHAFESHQVIGEAPHLLILVSSLNAYERKFYGDI